MLQIEELNTSTDLDSFYDILSQTIRKDFAFRYPQSVCDYFLEQIYSKESFKTRSQRYNLVARFENEIVGIASGDRGFGGVGFLTWLGVMEEYRNRGIGSKLVESYEKYCKENGCHLIELNTFSKIESFYLEKGYIRIGIREKGYFGVENLIMNKSL